MGQCIGQPVLVEVPTLQRSYECLNRVRYPNLAAAPGEPGRSLRQLLWIVLQIVAVVGIQACYFPLLRKLSLPNLLCVLSQLGKRIWIHLTTSY